MMQATSTIEGRLDITTLATLTDYFDSVGTPARSRSDLLWKATQLLAELLVHNDKVKRREDIEDAYMYLTKRYGNMNRGGRGIRATMMALQTETLMKDGFNPDIPAVRRKSEVEPPDREAMMRSTWEAVNTLREQGGQAPVPWEEWLATRA